MSIDLSEVSEFLASEDAPHIIRSFARLKGPVRTTFVAHLMAVASQEPLYVHVEIPDQAGKTSQQPLLEDDRRKPCETEKEPSREPERRKDGFFSETNEMRVIERRLRGESINAIRLAEGMPYNDVKVIIDAARERGMPVDLPQVYRRPKEEPAAKAKPTTKSAVPQADKRRKLAEPMPPLPHELGVAVRRVAIELRLQGYSPTKIAQHLGGIKPQMIHNAFKDEQGRRPGLNRPPILEDLPELGESPLAAQVRAARAAQEAQHRGV